MRLARQIHGQTAIHDQCYPIDPEELLSWSHRARLEVESFINTHLDDPSMGWPVVSHQVQQFT